MNEVTHETLREPRAGIHENGEEELKSWGALYNQCLWAAARIEALERALREIAEGKGRFSRDPLTHASNVIEDMRAIAATAIAEATGGRHGTHSG